MRKCELCECPARMYCESDQASLCWDCDEKVHCANFLVAKHLRCLLCHVCQSLTPWKASGPKLGPTVSVCDACVAAARCGVNDDDKAVVRRGSQSERISGHDETDDDDDYEDEDDDDDDDEDPDEEEEEEDDENQVVPWSGDDSQSPPQPPPPPPPVSSSCSSISEEDFSLKRMRDFGDLFSDDEIGCSSRPVTNEEAAASMSSYRPLKQPRPTISDCDRDHGQSVSRSTAIISSLRGLQNQKMTDQGDASAAITGICRLSRDRQTR